MSLVAESEALHGRVVRFIAGSGAGLRTEGFDELAVAVAQYQARHAAAVARAFAAAGTDAAEITKAAEIPAIPTDAFRLRRIAAHPPELDERVFLSSGTTLAERGKHALRTTATYRVAALSWAERLLFPGRTADTRFAIVALLADETHAPESSLSFMVARFAEAVGTASWHWDGVGLDVEGVRRAVAAAARAQRPVLLAGTAFAFVHLVDARCELVLPPGSVVMNTGGHKGRSRQLDAAELRRAIAAVTEMPEVRVVGEYGMTELSSQLYQAGLAHALGWREAPSSSTAYYAPPWLRVTAVDAVTFAPVVRGEEGLARFVDLANVDSAVAILTADRIVELEDGGIELRGRQAGATPRGCSLALEPWLDQEAERRGG
ncbi:MAG: acyl-protein synthetase [Myxococcales bacterium]|nr:acyl-protein synthetase [Myxococcales bacterium]